MDLIANAQELQIRRSSIAPTK